MAEGCLEKISDGDGRQSVLLASRLKANKVTFVDLDLGGVFDNDDSLIVRNITGQDIQQRGFTGSGAARDKNVPVLQDVIFKFGGQALGQGSDSNEVVDREVAGVEFANGECDPVDAAGWDDTLLTAKSLNPE